LPTHNCVSLIRPLLVFHLLSRKFLCCILRVQIIESSVSPLLLFLPVSPHFVHFLILFSISQVFDRLFPASANDSTTSDDTDSATTATSKNSGNSQSAAAHEKLPPPSLIVFAGSEGEGVFEGSGGGSKDEVPPGKKPPTSPTEVCMRPHVVHIHTALIF